jgi:hypothetical protein
MDLNKMIFELQAEKERLDEAIQALERLSAGAIRRRGRPPRWIADEIARHAQRSENGEEMAAAAKKS